MSKDFLPWTRNDKPVNVAQATQDELLDLWYKDRNGMQGVVAADEMMKRLYTLRKMKL